jgi:hypothetical protein
VNNEPQRALSPAPRRPARRADASGIAWLLGVFVSFNVASFVYTLVTGEYNGDFYGSPIQLPGWVVVACFVATTLPFIIAARMARATMRRRGRMSIAVPVGFLKVAVPVTLLLQIYVTYQHQVGIAGLPPYEVAGPVKILILLLNRFQPFYIGTLLILLLPRGSRLTWLIVALVVTVGLLRAGLGGFMYVGLVLMLKHSASLRAFVRRRWITILVAAAVAPLVVASLYQLRSALREDDQLQDLPIMTLATGLFLGRVSPLTNSMMILENDRYFATATRELDSTYFVQQALAGVFGASLAPKVTPQYLLINIDGNDIDRYSYMTGLIGDLAMARHKSWLVALLNLGSVLAMLAATFWLARSWRMENAVPFAFMLLLYPVMSGVAGEIAAILYFFALMTGTFAVVNLFRRRPRRQRGALSPALPAPLHREQA